jgi:hypothetical protein
MPAGYAQLVRIHPHPGRRAARGFADVGHRRSGFDHRLELPDVFFRVLKSDGSPTFLANFASCEEPPWRVAARRGGCRVAIV